MERVTAFFDALYRRKISREFDAMFAIVGDEGMGKSTFMVEATGRWQQILAKYGDMDSGEAGTVNAVLGRIVWEQDEYKNALADYPARSAIPVMDAARVLHKKKPMHSEQVELETDLLDSRMKEQLTFFGYQDWGLIPDMMQRRRLKYCFRIPRRGRVEGYSRASLDELYDTGDWPEPDLVDSFPDLTGTDIWTEFKERDRERKEARMRASEDPSPEDAARQEKIKTVLRAVKPWDDNDGMSYREAAKLVDYSRGWVSDRVQEWKDGDYDDLIDTPEVAIA